MVVKRYVVKEMPEALPQIRRDLGHDAVILSSRRIHERRWLGLVRSSRIEVLAASGADVPVSQPATGSAQGPAACLKRHGVRVPALLKPGLDWAQIELLLRQRLGGLDASPLGNASRVAVFVGPTGVGKTTTIAKLAALHVLAGQRVALVTTDLFRIAAVEQLRTYAQIMNAPMTVVEDVAELPQALAALAGYDRVFIDTAGHNLLAPRHAEQTRRVIELARPDETYLVLGLTAKDEDLFEIVARFRDVVFDKFLFTKLDETRTYGSVINLVWECRRPPSYATMGQNVPDDIATVSLAEWLRRMQGEGPA
ncbi:hypothetical protein [Alicyclobacillus kakegawensis]|uniref:flagellar biosynthesis protein FlhF n=1 Tax=Alicyclobacillus kakegawensis TaxID=392012 RepID=UPI00082C1AD1|nr:hypothetical protein [Alicyclobacillus kakegawensis]